MKGKEWKICRETMKGKEGKVGICRDERRNKRRAREGGKRKRNERIKH